jgi:cytoskeleton protein RodZ
MAIRISIRQLDALESGRFEILPAKVFSRGFVRAIAIHLGLDAERYAAAFASVWDGWAEGERSRTSSSIVQSDQHVRLSRPRRAVSMSTMLVGGGIALAIALVTFGAVFLRSRADRSSPRVPARARVERSTVPSSGPASLALPPSVASSTVALPAASQPASPGIPVPAPTTVPAEAPRAVAPLPAERPAAAAPAATAAPSVVLATPPAPAAHPRDGIVLTMTFRDDCWTEVSADGRPVAAELFRKGVVKEFSGTSKFVVTLGNSGAVSLSLNGAPVSFDRSSGKVVKNLVLDRATPRSRPSPG